MLSACRWEGEGLDEVGIVAEGERTGETVIRINERFFRPAEVDLLLGNPAKAQKVRSVESCCMIITACSKAWNVGTVK